MSTVSAYGLVLCGLYAPVLSGLVQDWWQDPDYSHGFLIPFLAGAFLWQGRATLYSLQPRPSIWGIVGIASGMGLLLLGTFGAELFLMRVSFMVVLAALVLLHAGWSILRALWFPLAYLLFMIPLPALVYNAVAFPLQLIAADVAADVLHLLYIPVFREGNIISLTFVTLEVNEACSGIRSLASLSALTVIFAQWTQPTPLRKLVVTFSAFPITIVTNVARVVVTGILANYVNASLAQGFFHAFSGWVVFIIAFMLLGLVGWLCRTFVKHHESLV